MGLWDVLVCEMCEDVWDVWIWEYAHCDSHMTVS